MLIKARCCRARKSNWEVLAFGEFQRSLGLRNGTVFGDCGRSPTASCHAARRSAATGDEPFRSCASWNKVPTTPVPARKGGQGPSAHSRADRCRPREARCEERQTPGPSSSSQLGAVDRVRPKVAKAKSESSNMNSRRSREVQFVRRNLMVLLGHPDMWLKPPMQRNETNTLLSNASGRAP